ncbi:MAG: futalosine hydrolase [Bacteroidetes bacterium]|nr:futalosine hydrolase [Bacteroidota bacterium]
MDILIVAATKFEIEPLLTATGAIETRVDFWEASIGSNSVHFVVTGVGMVATTFSLTKILTRNKYDLVVNLGIAGAINRELALTQAVVVATDSFYELGVEDGEQFIPWHKMNIASNDDNLFLEGQLWNDTGVAKEFNLEQVSGITVNRVHGNDASIEQLKKSSQAAIETMEGAAVFYVCKSLNVAFVAIRSISNYVELRNRENWKLNEAIKSLNEVVLQWLNNKS